MTKLRLLIVILLSVLQGYSQHLYFVKDVEPDSQKVFRSSDSWAYQDGLMMYSNRTLFYSKDGKLSKVAFNLTLNTSWKPIEVNGRFVFAVNATPDSVGLWTTDGTWAGTIPLAPLSKVVIKTINRLAIGNQLYFVGTSAAHGNELWITDGTVANTKLVKDIRSGAASSSISKFVLRNDEIFFFANDGLHGYELWYSKGTEVSTHLVQEIYPGAAGLAYTPELVATANYVAFEMQDDQKILYLWYANSTSLTKKLTRGNYLGKIVSPVGDELIMLVPDNGFSKSLYGTYGNGTSSKQIPFPKYLGDLYNDTLVLEAVFNQELFIGGNKYKNNGALVKLDISTPTPTYTIIDSVPYYPKDRLGNPPAYVNMIAFKDMYLYERNINDSISSLRAYKNGSTVELDRYKKATKTKSGIVANIYPFADYFYVYFVGRYEISGTSTHVVSGVRRYDAQGKRTNEYSDLSLGVATAHNLYASSGGNSPMTLYRLDTQGNSSVQPYAAVPMSPYITNIAATNSTVYFTNYRSDDNLYESDGTAEGTNIIQSKVSSLSLVPANNYLAYSGSDTVFFYENGKKSFLKLNGGTIRIVGDQIHHFTSSWNYIPKGKASVVISDSVRNTSYMMDFTESPTKQFALTWSKGDYFLTEIRKADGQKLSETKLPFSHTYTTQDPTNPIFYVFYQNGNTYTAVYSDHSVKLLRFNEGDKSFQLLDSKVLGTITNFERKKHEGEEALMQFGNFVKTDGSQLILLPPITFQESHPELRTAKWINNGWVIFFQKRTTSPVLVVMRSPKGTAQLDSLKQFNTYINAVRGFSVERMGTHLYFIAENYPLGNTLWQTDGTSQGTVPTLPEVIGKTLLDINNLKATSNSLYFFADDLVHGNELWMLTDSASVITALDPASTVAEQEGYLAYPNPSSEKVVLKNQQPVPFIVDIYSLEGQKYASYANYNPSQEVHIGDKGFYIARITDITGKKTSLKLVIQ